MSTTTGSRCRRGCDRWTLTGSSVVPRMSSPRALGWLEASARQPFFLWVHLFDPHDPYTPPPPFSEEFRDRPYDGEIAYVDASLAKLFEKLKGLGLYDRSFIVLMSDHGESLGEHQEMHHGYFIYDATLKVPLILKFPGSRFRGTRLTNKVRCVDVAPTILQQLSIPSPPSFQGESLLAMVAGKRAGVDLPVYSETYYPKIHFNWSPLFSYQPGDDKYIEAPRSELYDTRTDRQELNNIAQSNQALAGRLKSDLLAFQRRYSAAGSQSDAAQQLDPGNRIPAQVAWLCCLHDVLCQVGSGLVSPRPEGQDPGLQPAEQGHRAFPAGHVRQGDRGLRSGGCRPSEHADRSFPARDGVLRQAVVPQGD